MAQWEGSDTEEVKVSMNRDFIDVRLPYQEVIALVQSYQMGGISLDTLLHNLKQGEVIPHDVSIEEEMERILAGQDEPEPYQSAGGGWSRGRLRSRNSSGGEWNRRIRSSLKPILTEGEGVYTLPIDDVLTPPTTEKPLLHSKGLTQKK